MNRALKTIMIVLLIVAILAVGFLGFLGIKEYLRKVEVFPELAVEIGSPMPSAQAFVKPGQKDAASFVGDTTHVDMGKLGTYQLQLFSKRETYQVAIRVVDTVAPDATTRDLTVMRQNMPQPEDFLVDIQDKTQVAVEFAAQPDAADPQPQTVPIRLTDEAGNTSIVTAQLTVIIDTTAPVISGVKDITVEEGATVSYRTGVTVTDDIDQVVSLEIDASGVDTSKWGKYTVTYKATDSSGNMAIVSANVIVTVKEQVVDDVGPDANAEDVPEEQVVAMVDKVLSQILQEDMTDRQKVTAIHKWVRNNVAYTGKSLGSDFTQAAYQALVTRGGDCRNFFGLTRMMLDQAGIPNVDVAKIPNSPTDSHHYWHLVSIDGGETYYHVDTAPRVTPDTFLLWTDKMMDDYSAKHKNCFNRDKSLYPATPEERP